MHKYTCVFCDKKLKVANYKARKMHNNGTKHRQMLRTHYLEVLEDEEVRKELEGLQKKSEGLQKKSSGLQKKSSGLREGRMIKDRHKVCNDHKEVGMRINGKNRTHSVKFNLPPMTIPKDFRVPPPPASFHLPPGFDFEDERNFDPDLNKAISKIK